MEKLSVILKRRPYKRKLLHHFGTFVERYSYSRAEHQARDFHNRKRDTMVHKGLPSLISLLVLMLAVMNLAHGNHIKIKKERTKRKSGDCSSEVGVQQDNKLPESVRVNIHIVHTEPANKLLPDVWNRSLSPWNYSKTEDPSRFPHVIYEASCRYSACLDSTGQGLNYGMNSVPIQQEMLVLKRKPMGCQQAYWLEKQMVTVGCTCVIPLTKAYSKKSGKSVGN